MKTIPRLVVMLMMMCCLRLAAQQDAGASKPTPPKPAGEQAATAMPMPKPAPEMTKLIKMMAGNWIIAEKLEVSPMMPNGGTGNGVARFYQGPGGLALVENYHSTGALGDFMGMGTWWWDPKAQLFHGLWCDNMTPNGCDTSGVTRWDGDKLVGTMEGDMGGQKMIMRFIYSDFKPDSFVMTMEMGPSASKMQKSMTVTYTRAPAPGHKM